MASLFFYQGKDVQWTLILTFPTCKRIFACWKHCGKRRNFPCYQFNYINFIYRGFPKIWINVFKVVCYRCVVCEKGLTWNSVKKSPRGTRLKFVLFIIWGQKVGTTHIKSIKTRAVGIYLTNVWWDSNPWLMDDETGLLPLSDCVLNTSCDKVRS